MNKHCWYNLDLDVTEAIRQDFLFDHPPWTIKSFRNPLEIFRAEWCDSLRHLGFGIFNTMIFYKSANSRSPVAHIDGYNTAANGAIGNGAFAINWVIGGRNSDMVWYQQPVGKTQVTYTKAGTAYLSWPVEKLTEIDRCQIQSPTLVRIDVPHTIEVQDEDRIGISIRVKYVSPETLNLLEYFRSKKMLVERK
jgi:hypothetical protein